MILLVHRWEFKKIYVQGREAPGKVHTIHTHERESCKINISYLRIYWWKVIYDDEPAIKIDCQTI